MFGWEKKSPEKFDIAPYFKKKDEFVQMRKVSGEPVVSVVAD